MYTLWGAHAGWPLRIGSTLFLFAACLAAYRFAREQWGEREGITAAWLLGLFLTFGIPSAVMAMAPDLLMVLPHLVAVCLAWRGRSFWSGFWAGIAFLCNTKGAIVLAACLLFQWRSVLPVILGFAIPNLAFLCLLAARGAVTAYWEQVWVTGWLYSRDTFLEHPFWEALKRSANWAGFHAALLVSAAVWWRRERDWRWAAWLALAAVSVFAGWRFFPRYYFALLPPLVFAASRGIWMLSARCRMAVLGLLLIPVTRFAPAYARAATRGSWADTALMDDSREAARILRSRGDRNSTLFVWGYRPDLFVFSGMPAGTPFLDSQPISGVFADRHLFSAHVSVPDTRRNIDRLITARPQYIVDGLGLLNPELAITRNARLQRWLALYQEVARTRNSVIYALPAAPDRSPLVEER